MSLIMSSLSHEEAKLSLRERFSFTPAQQAELMQTLRHQPGVEGAVLLSTCNRTEIYLSGDCGTPWRLLCRGCGIPTTGLESAFRTASGEDAAAHLMEVACGLRSQLQGEDQILSQVRKAMDFARDCGTMDHQLETLFRMAVTVGKQARTQVTLPHGSPSAAQMTEELLTQQMQGLAGRRILVIGNGQMGRMVAERLQQAGAEVTVTLRSYRHGGSVVPHGCSSVPYEERTGLYPTLDAIVSATTSPHYTVTAEQLAGRSSSLCLIDLAVPRDIALDCASLSGVSCYNIDDFHLPQPELHQAQAQITALIQAQLQEYLRWKRSQSTPEEPFRFPMFVDLKGKRVVLVGGGKIAHRRMATLRLFGCQLVVIAPALHAPAADVLWLPRPYRPEDLDGAVMVIAATDSREENHRIGLDAQTRGIPVSVADCEAECTFYFPAICTGEHVIAGVVSHGKNHTATVRAAKEIRKTLQHLDAEQKEQETYEP